LEMSETDSSNKKAKGDSSGGSDTSGDGKEPMEEVRILIENHQVGGIIGKGGANVTRVREESGASVSILKAESRNVQERIMIIRGTVAQVSKAANHLTQLTLDARPRDKKDSEKDPQTSFTILVHRAAVGAVIGKGGATIRETQQDTGTRIQVSNEPLPRSTEKTVTIHGSPNCIEAAALRVLTQLKDNPIRKQTRSDLYVPGEGSYSPPSYNSPPPPTYAPPPALYPPLPPHYGSQQQPLSTQKIAIPTVCAGCVIGKGGAVIKDLRAQSGTSISIADPDSGSPTERVVTLTGPPQGIQTAVYLIRQIVEGFQPQDAPY